MTSLVKHVQHVNNAIYFRNSLHSSSVYIGIGKETDWVPVNTPSIPVDNIDSDNDFWANLISVAKVTNDNIVNVIPRRSWTSGELYNVFDESSVSGYTEPFYVLSSVDDGVYKCIQAGNQGATSEPGNGGTHNTGDGYIWEFKYKMTVLEMTDLVTNTWMPCHDGFEHELGSNHVMIYRRIPDPTSTSGKIPEVSYRQTAVLVNPKAANNTVAIFEYGTKAEMKSTLDLGILVQLDNRLAVNRSATQSETVINVIQF